MARLSIYAGLPTASGNVYNLELTGPELWVLFRGLDLLTDTEGRDARAVLKTSQLDVLRRMARDMKETTDAVPRLGE